MKSNEIWTKVHELEKQILKFRLIDEKEALGKTVKGIYTYYVDVFGSGSNHCHLITFTDNTALWWDGSYFSIFIHWWRDYDWKDTVKVYESEWFIEIYKNTPELINYEIMQECLKMVKLARETQHQERLAETIKQKEEELKKN